jgi:phage tail sheath gpL-like
LPLQTLELVGIRPPKSRSDWFSITQRNQLYQDGIAGFRVLVDGTVLLGRVVTTYQTNSYGQPDITWLDVETRAQIVYFVRYNRQRITQVFGRKALADDNATNNPGIVTPRNAFTSTRSSRPEVWSTTRPLSRRRWNGPLT